MECKSIKYTDAYGGIDGFRIVAALLIVAIHTGPLASYTEIGDFLLTRVVARVAVPFFLMATGFFLIPRLLEKKDGVLRKYLSKTGLLYAVSILLYLPVMIYAGYFRGDSVWRKFLPDLFFNGPFYHLWYLPGAMLGMCIVALLVKRCRPGALFIITGGLYIIGLFGDSYFGLIETAPVISDIYGALFQVFDYTRNGVFFAPLFLWLGGWIALRKKSPGKIFGLILTSLLYITEALLLHFFQLQRHDSMYLCLPFVMYFLFSALLRRRRASSPSLRKLAMLVYILHPMAIILVRGAAKLLRLTPWLIENSLIHFLCVAAVSLTGSGILLLINKRIHSHKRHDNRAWAEINLSLLGQNINALRSKLTGGCDIMAVVKADAYGHGALRISKKLNQSGVQAFAVATAEEGIQLRRHGVKGEILILGYTPPAQFPQLRRFRLSQTITDYTYAVILNRFSQRLRVHLAVDTGMHRIGVPFSEIREISEIYGMERLEVAGIYTHLCCADSLDAEDIRFTEIQIERFADVLKQIKNAGFSCGKIHIQSSYGLLNYPDLPFPCDYIRAGISIYGCRSREDDPVRNPVSLHPILTLKARVTGVRRIAAGETVGYGRAYTAARDIKTAVISIGYADGLPRSLKNGQVIVKGQYAPIIGRICMDQIIVDVTDIDDVQTGNIATLIGNSGAANITAAQVAGRSGTITNELLSRLGSRLPRIYS